MNTRDMKKMIPCTSCRVLKSNRFELCTCVEGVNTHDRCPIMIGKQLVLQYTTDEDYDRFVSGIKRI